MTRFSFFLIAALFFSVPAFAEDTLTPSTEPAEIYGSTAAPRLRIGNGGAGATGIFRALADGYPSVRDGRSAIAWYRDISRNALLNLRYGKVDVALVYDPEQVQAAIAEGLVTEAWPAFNDRFVIVGPSENLANVEFNDTAVAAFKKIALYGETAGQGAFLSRDDMSATNIKERSLWSEAQSAPWDAEWYKRQHVFPAAALEYANTHRLYTLTDWATWISNRGKMKHLKLVVATDGDPSMANRCVALIKKPGTQAALDFIQFLVSAEGQRIISEFGRQEFGEPLFLPAVVQ